MQPKVKNKILPFCLFLGICLICLLAYSRFNVLNRIDITHAGDYLNAQEFFEMTKDENAVILDVRTPEEYNNGHLKNSININFYDTATFNGFVGKLDKNKDYLIYCRTDNRSGKTNLMMKDKGFTQVHILKGGILAWTLDNMPVTK